MREPAMRRSREVPASGSRALETATESVPVPPGDPLELLPLRTRAVLVLRANGMQMTLIAAVLGISRQTAYEHLRRAREILRPVAPISGEPG
jgi:DNA-binding NarL/FixJ family response regulator